MVLTVSGRVDGPEAGLPAFSAFLSRRGPVPHAVLGNRRPRAIEEFGVRFPDVLCGDVGTTIRKRENGAWTFDHGWTAHVRRSSPRWDVAVVRDAVAGMDGLREQEDEHLNQFKQSYYVNLDKQDAVLERVKGLIEGKFDQVIVYSVDVPAHKGLIDVLPKSATKQTALGAPSSSGW